MPGTLPTEEGSRTCPDAGGGTNFYSPSYDPTNRLFIVTARETCATYYSYNEPFKDGERYAGGGGVRVREHVNYGALRALDPITGDRKWEFRYPNVSSSGVLTTASGLVFAGDGDGNIVALESKTGRSLWHYQLGVRYSLNRRNDVHGRWPAVSSSSLQAARSRRSRCRNAAVSPRRRETQGFAGFWIYDQKLCGLGAVAT